jgi:hypothetical protein
MMTGDESRYWSPLRGATTTYDSYYVPGAPVWRRRDLHPGYEALPSPQATQQRLFSLLLPSPHDVSYTYL